MTSEIEIELANRRKRRAAQRAGRPTYAHDVITTRSACTVCGQLVRSSVQRLWSSCDCPGARWHCTAGGVGAWERVDTDGETDE